MATIFFDCFNSMRYLYRSFYEAPSRNREFSQNYFHIQIVVVTFDGERSEGNLKNARRRRAFIVWIFASIEDIMPMEKLLRSIWGRIFIFILTAFRWIYVHFVDSYFVLITLSAMKWVDDERWLALVMVFRFSFIWRNKGFCLHCPNWCSQIKVALSSMENSISQLDWSHLPKLFCFRYN